MRASLTVIFIASLLLIGLQAIGQDGTVANLLENGDFEGAFVALDGESPRNVAAGWTPWHVPADSNSPSFANHNPNYDQETDRIRLVETGKAQKYFTLFATHQGGIYQEVDSLNSGSAYRFSIYAHVWSSSFEDANVSEDPGDVVLRVGIDPTGGTDGSSEDIIWSTAATFFYDAYRQYAVIATAQSSSVTVFVESTVGEPRANNYIYLDDAVLEVAGGAVAEATPTSEANDDLAQATPTVEELPTDPAPADEPDEEPGDDDTQGQVPAPTATSSPIPTATATLAPSSTPTATATEPAQDDEMPVDGDSDESVTHVVAAGDTVSALAYQYGSSVDAINLANGLAPNNFIAVGQTLVIPINLPVGTGVPTATSTPTPTATPTATPTPTATATPITYQILPGDTLVDIALRYDSSVDDIAQLNSIVNVHQIDVGVILVIPSPIPPTATTTPFLTPTPFPTATVAPARWSGGNLIHVVKAGEVLSGIAYEYDTTVAEIVALNNLDNPSRIFPSQELRIPVKVTATATPWHTPTSLPSPVPTLYTVGAGETLYSIAASLGISVVELAALNNIINYDQLTVGQVLLVPG